MVLTPQLLQAIKLLQMPNVELSSFIENELASNPLLERAEERESLTQEAHEGEPAAPAARFPIRLPDAANWPSSLRSTTVTNTAGRRSAAHRGEDCQAAGLEQRPPFGLAASNHREMGAGGCW